MVMQAVGTCMGLQDLSWGKIKGSLLANADELIKMLAGYNKDQIQDKMI